MTHQPQIARFADHHYSIAKRVEAGRTITQIKELSGEQRITEMVRMLGASEEIRTARETSQWLLESAGEKPTFIAGREGLRKARRKKDS